MYAGVAGCQLDHRGFEFYPAINTCRTAAADRGCNIKFRFARGVANERSKECLDNALTIHSLVPHSSLFSSPPRFLIRNTYTLPAEACIREDDFDSRVRRGITSLEGYAWPNATIPYEISEQFSKYSTFDHSQSIRSC